MSKCLFERTDRGLRVKTRRGRGKDAVNEGITFEHIRMDEVLTPFVVNSFYFCDKDGKTDYVQSRETLPVDDRTPGFGATTFCDIEATNCHAAAAYITGLPESKVTRLTFQDVHVTFAPDAEPFVPAMACGVEPMVCQGIIAQNVKVLDLQNVVIEGQDGEDLQLQNVDKVIRAWAFAPKQLNSVCRDARWAGPSRPIARTFYMPKLQRRRSTTKGRGD